MRLAVSLIGGLVWFSWAPTATASAEAAVRAGLEQFEQGRQLISDPAAARECFHKAAGHFEAAAQQGANTPGLFLNLGNAYFLADELPQAIFAFRRGLRLDPEDRLLQTNLRYARQKVDLPQGINMLEPRGWGPSWGKWRRGFALACYLLAIPAIFLWAATRRLSAGIAVMLLVFVCAGLETYGWLSERDRRHQEKDYPLLVIRDKAPLRKGNGPSFALHPHWPLLPAGLEARRLLERGGWLQIEIPGRAVGWVPRESVLMDEDEPSVP